MRNDSVYNFIVYLLIFIIIELLVAIVNQYHVPHDKKYEDLTIIQKILSTLRFHFNIIETIIIFYVLLNYGKYLNYLTLLLFVSILFACFRYFLFALGLIYKFVDKTERNESIVNFIERKFGKIQNIGIVLLLIFIVFRIYYFKVY
jgi:hypothetical protein